MAPLIARLLDSEIGDIETAAACAMLHSFYTEIEKILTLIARGWDTRKPASDAWHKELLNQMAAPTNTRPAVMTSALLAKVDQTYSQTQRELEIFQTFLRSQSRPSQ